MRHCIVNSNKKKPPVEFVAIGGRSSSGKSSIAAKIYKLLQQFDKYPIQIIWLGLDGFYKSLNAKQLKNVDTYNFDDSDAIDLEMGYQELKKFFNGETMTVPKYDYVTHQRTDMFSQVRIAPGVKKVIVIFEGLHVMNEIFLPFHTHSIWVHVDVKEALRRRINRNIGIGREESEIRKRWNTTVEPTFQKYENKYRDNADEIYWNGADVPENTDDYDLIIKHPDNHSFEALIERITSLE